MKEFTAKHFQTTADYLARSSSGQRATLKYRGGHTGVWDEHRQEYVGGAIVWAYIEAVECLVKRLNYNDVKYGGYGDVETGDLFLAIPNTIATELLPELRVILQGQEYLVIPNTVIPYGSMTGLIGDTGTFRILHARYLGEQL